MAAQEAANANNINWQQYFESISQVCPWSLGAYNRGGIDVQSWCGEAVPLDSREARIYLAPRHNQRQLKKMTDKFNNTRPLEEWLWSHPKLGENATPVPCFIQQHRDVLERARKSLKNKDLHK